MPRPNRWNINYKTSGIYMITNNTTGDNYIGSSKCIPTRLTAHFRNGYAKRKFNNKMYDDIVKLGKSKFKWEVLCECKEEDLIEIESYYFEKLKPTYNMIHPKETMLSRDKELITKLTTLNKERDSIPVEALINGEVIHRFKSVGEASDWINKNVVTTTSSKTSNICKALKGKIKKCYGYNWRYSEV